MPLSIFWPTFALLNQNVLMINSFKVLKIYFISLLMIHIVLSFDIPCQKHSCIHGRCLANRCVCDIGWQGFNCNRCSGRVRLTAPEGYISDGPGNYTVDFQCSWLIDSTQPNTSILLRLESFETECGWDHVYIFDGNSIFSPLVAAFSGSLVKEHTDLRREVITHSGYAFLYFYSDAAFNMTGFNISYSMLKVCPQDCSQQGVCLHGQCHCNSDWTGPACNIPACPNFCNYGTCDHILKKCICNPGYVGSDCSHSADRGWWEELDSPGQPQSLHSATVVQDTMYVFGGENFGHSLFHNMMVFNFTTSQWSPVQLSASYGPVNRHSHTLVTYQDKIYMYGGMLSPGGTIVREHWMFDPVLRAWSPLNTATDHCQADLCGPLATMGHTATVVDNRMIIIFGYSPLYGYLNMVQQYHFETGQWEVVQTTGAIVKGGLGHSSAYDTSTRQIYVHGGYHSRGTEGGLVNFLYGYNPWKNSWMLYKPGPSSRYLHTATMLDGLMLVFGGNTHNGTSHNPGGHCFSSDTLLYDIVCDRWHHQEGFPIVSSLHSTARLGHSSVLYNNSLYIYGGFNGELLNHLLKFNPGNCRNYSNSWVCDNALPGVRCLWNYERRQCLPFSRAETPIVTKHLCSRKSINTTSLCSQLTSCLSCLKNTYNCLWCGTFCTSGKCGAKGVKVTALAEHCQDTESNSCSQLDSCQACHLDPHCGWQLMDDRCYVFVHEAGTHMEKAVLSEKLRVRCEAPCSARTTCQECTAGPCMWCGSQRRCLDLSAYSSVYSMAQCLDWTTQSRTCPRLECSSIQTCQDCQSNARCGWCDNGSGTGMGQCMEGSLTGPRQSWSVDGMECPSSRWYFIKCPACQCNGHSTCRPNSTLCQQPCLHDTQGHHCEKCRPGYFGNAVNGGNCTRCFCNSHGEFCDPSTGACFCNTKGITGAQCERCDEPNHYMGNPKENGGTCYYNLLVDYQYTFNMSKLEDRYLTQINLINSPLRSDLDVDFSVTCSDSALVNISIASLLRSPKILYENKYCSSFKLRFPHSDNSFGMKNTTFFVSIFNFTAPFVVQISFSQHRTLDLLQFFVTFSSCFLSLLITAAILWKIKLKYDLYRRRQRLFVEMEQLALRPFFSAVTDLTDTSANGTAMCPTPIAMEPLHGGKAAVLTVLVKLPFGGGRFSPRGSSGMGIASALVTIGIKSPTQNVLT